MRKKRRWRSRGLNPGPRTCEARALPLSYTPCYWSTLRGSFIKYYFSFHIGFIFWWRKSIGFNSTACELTSGFSKVIVRLTEFLESRTFPLLLACSKVHTEEISENCFLSPEEVTDFQHKFSAVPAQTKCFTEVAELNATPSRVGCSANVLFPADSHFPLTHYHVFWDCLQFWF